MELRAVVDPALVLAARENLLFTYQELATALPGTKWRSYDSFQWARQERPISFANYVAGFQSSESEQEDLRLVRSDPPSRIHFISGDTGRVAAQLLFDQQYRQIQRLDQMILTETHPFAEVPQGTITERSTLIEFVVTQFFSAHSQEFRDLVMLANVGSRAKIFYLGSIAHPQAVAMSFESETSVGLYNLCVRRDVRRQGLGSKLVEAVINEAHRIGKPLVLQCDSQLKAWYDGFGFEKVGEIQSFARNRYQIL